MSDYVTETQAQNVLDYIRAVYNVSPDEAYGPTIVWGWHQDGVPSIIWEDGPFEWTLAYNEYAAGYAALDEGIGASFSAPAPLAPPTGVFCEPYNSFVLQVYTA